MPATFGDQRREWEHLTVVVKNNATELQGLSGFASRLETLLPLLTEASIRQATVQAENQQATRDLDALKAEANDLAIRIKAGVKSTYGYRSEKLVEFRLKPLRRRPRTKTEKKPPEARATGEGDLAT
jgi:hypothetical protein